jgi:hypothetical protein
MNNQGQLRNKTNRLIDFLIERKAIHLKQRIGPTIKPFFRKGQDKNLLSLKTVTQFVAIKNYLHTKMYVT